MNGGLILIMNHLVREVDYRWNQIYASLMTMYCKLEMLIDEEIV